MIKQAGCLHVDTRQAGRWLRPTWDCRQAGDMLEACDSEDRVALQAGTAG